jgi:hypothetical protein
LQYDERYTRQIILFYFVWTRNQGWEPYQKM